MTETWVEADAYEPYIGRWSRAVADEFVTLLDVLPGRAWVDVGCGTGALSHTILARAAPRLLVGIDRSAGFVAGARAHAPAQASFVVADARDLPLPAGRFDAAVSGLVLNFVPEPERMIADMKRVVRPGGRLGLYVWDYAGRMQLLRYFWSAVVAMDPAMLELDEGRRFPLCRPDALHDLFREGGIEQVQVRAIDVPTVFRNFDDFWTPFLGGQGPAPAYAISLDERRRDALCALLRSRLPAAEDGSIPLLARAWAVTGTVA
jgi:SAM-dependent methyltransferase